MKKLPKPYYQSDTSVIYHADCRDILPLLDKKGVILTDPPYGVGIDYISYEDSVENLKELIETCWPLVLKFPLTVAATGIKNMHLYSKYDWVLCWFCPAGVSVGPWGFCQWHPFVVWGSDPYLKAGRGSAPDGVSYTPSTPKTITDIGHPVSKPLEVMKWLVRRLTVQPSTFIDPFMGSGMTLLAAQQLGHKSIGIEIEEEYCDIAANQLEKGPVGLPIDGMRHSKKCR